MVPLGYVVVDSFLVEDVHDFVEPPDLFGHRIARLRGGDLVGGHGHAGLSAPDFPARVRDGRSEEVRDLEGDDFPRVVFDDFVVDLRSYFLDAVEDGLSALVVAVEIIYVALVPVKGRKDLVQHLYDVLRVDRFRVSVDDVSPGQHRRDVGEVCRAEYGRSVVRVPFDFWFRHSFTTSSLKIRPDVRKVKNSVGAEEKTISANGAEHGRQAEGERGRPSCNIIHLKRIFVKCSG